MLDHFGRQGFEQFGIRVIHQAETTSALGTPSSVDENQRRRVEDGAADEDKEQEDSSSEREDEHGEPIERTEAAEESGEQEATPGVGQKLEVAPGIECNAAEVLVLSLSQDRIGIMRQKVNY